MCVMATSLSARIVLVLRQPCQPFTVFTKQPIHAQGKLEVIPVIVILLFLNSCFYGTLLMLQKYQYFPQTATSQTYHLIFMVAKTLYQWFIPFIFGINIEPSLMINLRLAISPSPHFYLVYSPLIFYNRIDFPLFSFVYLGQIWKQTERRMVFTSFPV